MRGRASRTTSTVKWPTVKCAPQPPEPDYSEWPLGPSLIALAGSDDPASEFGLGDRGYAWHRHVRGQVFCVEVGLIHMRTTQGQWLLPPRRAGWIPPGVDHEVRVSGGVRGWSLLVAPDACPELPAEPCVIAISDVLRALVHRAIDWDKGSALAPAQERIAAVIRDELRRTPHDSMHLPMPRDARLLRVAHAVLAAPGAVRMLEEWAAVGALSPRSLRRLMVAETGMTFGQWRRHAQLAHGMDLLARGMAVGRVADELGYASPSSFIAVFRGAFGMSPARYAERFSGGVAVPVNKAL